VNVAVNLQVPAGTDKAKDDKCIATLQIVHPINIRKVTSANIDAGHGAGFEPGIFGSEVQRSSTVVARRHAQEDTNATMQVTDARPYANIKSGELIKIVIK